MKGKKMKVKDMVKFVEVAHNKDVPKDVKEVFKKERKGVKVGDMDFVHFVRAFNKMQKDARE